MKLRVKKSKIGGVAFIPGSKSHTIRAVAIASLAKGESVITEPLVSSDTLSAVRCYSALGADIDISNPLEWKIVGTGGKITIPEEPIDVGNSGTTMRLAMSSAALASAGQKIILTGDDQIQSRPVGPLIRSLNDLGADCCSLNGNDCAPVSVEGTLKGGKTNISCFTSQYLSSLLLACPLAQNDTEINVSLLNEPDYVQMTLDWLDRQGIEYTNDQMRYFKIKGGQAYNRFNEVICSDFSSATFFFCAAAILKCRLSIKGLDFSDSQPDKAVVDYLKQMGAKIEINGDTVTIEADSLKGTTIDMNRTPDALPAMAVTAAFAEGKTELLNVPQARNKETDRIKCMAEELRKMSIRVDELPDGLIIHGGAEPAREVLNGRSDHRIVMALSLAGLALEGQTVIDTAEAINVTFPEFVDLMISLGANMQIIE